MSTNNTKVSKVQVTKQTSVDIANSGDTAAAKLGAQNEPSMAEYAARRDAEARGETVVTDKTAAATDETAAATDETAAATDETAAATDEGDDKKSQASSRTDEELLAEISDETPAKKGINERFSKLSNERKEAIAAAEAAKAETAKAKAEAEEAKKETERLKQEAEAARAAAASLPDAKDDVKPDRDNFDDPDEFAIALAAYAARQEQRKINEVTQKRLKENEEKAKTEASEKQAAEAKAKVEELHKNFNERLATSKADYPDFDEKVSNNDKLIVRNEAFFLIEKSELGPHILYKLANDPEELKNLNALAQSDPAAMALRIGELQAEARIARKPKPSKAAVPHKSVGSRASPERTPIDELPMDQYAAARAEQDRDEAARKAKMRIRH